MADEGIHCRGKGRWRCKEYSRYKRFHRRESAEPYSSPRTRALRHTLASGLREVKGKVAPSTEKGEPVKAPHCFVMRLEVELQRQQHAPRRIRENRLGLVEGAGIRLQHGQDVAPGVT